MRASMIRTSILVILTISILALMKDYAVAGVYKEKGKAGKYLAEIKYAEGYLRFYIYIEPTMFFLTSVQNKYKIIEISVDNFSKSSLPLSADKDKVVIKFYNRDAVDGIIDLSVRDTKLWDSFTESMKEMLKYPQSIPPREKEIIYVFIPEPNLQELPMSVYYEVDSLKKIWPQLRYGVNISDEAQRRVLK